MKNKAILCKRRLF